MAYRQRENDHDEGALMRGALAESGARGRCAALNGRKRPLGHCG